MGTSEDHFILETFLDGCFSRAAAKIRNPYTYFTFITLTSCQKERIFMDVFLSKGFGEKCKHTEIALNFVQKQYFS